MTTVFPFTAIVGQDELRRALILNAVRPDIGGVLIRGERGTAKSTAARGLAALLPPIQSVVGCHYACDPSEPTVWCDECKERDAEGAMTHFERTTPFVDLPVGATEDRVVGTLNIEHVLRSGERRFEPGVLAEAKPRACSISTRSTSSTIMSSMFFWTRPRWESNIVEREGISFSHPSLFVLIGTMKPRRRRAQAAADGSLRPYPVSVQAVPDINDRTEILRRRLAFDNDRDVFGTLWADAENTLREAIVSAREPSAKR